jgi:hypothetical protein
MPTATALISAPHFDLPHMGPDDQIQKQEM